MSKEIDIEYYHQLALQKQKEHRKVLANLKKKPPKKPRQDSPADSPRSF